MKTIYLVGVTFNKPIEIMGAYTSRVEAEKHVSLAHKLTKKTLTIEEITTYNTIESFLK